MFSYFAINVKYSILLRHLINTKDNRTCFFMYLNFGSQIIGLTFLPFFVTSYHIDLGRFCTAMLLVTRIKIRKYEQTYLTCNVFLFGEIFEFLQFSRRKVFLLLHLLHDVKINIFERNKLRIVKMETLFFEIKSN